MQQERTFFDNLNSLGWYAHIFYIASVAVCGNFVINGTLIAIGGSNFWISVIGALIVAFFGIMLISVSCEWLTCIRNQFKHRSQRD